MHSRVGRWGWIICAASAAAVYGAVRLRKRAFAEEKPPGALTFPTRTTPISARGEVEPQVDIVAAPALVTPLQKSVKVAVEVTSTSDAALTGVPSQKAMSLVPQSEQPRTKSLTVMEWIMAASVLVIAISCLYGAAMLRRQSAGPSNGALASKYAATAREMLHLDQRPWVGLLRATPHPLDAAGGGITIQISNTGKSPALNVRIRQVIRVVESDEEPDTRGVETAPMQAAGMLMPGAEFTTKAWLRTSPSMVVAIRTGKARTVSVLLVTYDDIYQQSHSTEQCFFWQAGQELLSPCQGQDRAD